jgi:hypothetical protein
VAWCGTRPCWRPKLLPAFILFKILLLQVFMELVLETTRRTCSAKNWMSATPPALTPAVHRRRRRLGRRTRIWFQSLSTW